MSLPLGLLVLIVVWFVLSLLGCLFMARYMRAGNGPDLPDDAADGSGVDSPSHVA